MKNIIQFIIIILTLFFISSNALAQKNEIVTGKWGYIESRVNNLHLDVRGGTKAIKTPIWMYSRNTSHAQHWMFINAGGGYYFIKSRASGLYLEVKNGSKKSKTPIWQNKKNESSAQKWKPQHINGNYFYIQSKVSGLYLDVKGGGQEKGTPVWQYTFNRTAAQQWKLKGLTKVKTSVVAKYIGQYPKDRSNGWSEELQGIAHDHNNWYFTQKHRLWKFPITHDLNKSVKVNNLPGGVKTVTIPASLKRLGYNHYGDLVQYKGYLFIPLEAEGRNLNMPLLAVYYASTLNFVGSAGLSSFQNRAGWLAINPTNGLLYTSNKVINSANSLFIYKIDYNALRNNEVKVTFHKKQKLYDQGGRALGIAEYMQGGTFSDDGKHLYLVNGKQSSNTPASAGGIKVFNTKTFRMILKSSTGGKEFRFEYHPGWPNYEEPEGITYWNLNNRNVPNIKGKLHVILLNNDVSSSDEFWLKHYRIN